MNKFEILKEKLNNIRDYIMEVDVKSENAKVFLKDVYKGYIERLISAIDKRSLLPANGTAILGLLRGLSDYDELCSDEKLCEMAEDADNYFCNEFVK